MAQPSHVVGFSGRFLAECEASRGRQHGLGGSRASGGETPGERGWVGWQRGQGLRSSRERTLALRIHGASHAGQLGIGVPFSLL